MITSDNVNQAFDRLTYAFNELAKIEDQQTELTKELAEYKDGSEKAACARQKIAELQPKIAAGQRAYRLAGMECDRIRLLLDVEKIALGRD